MAKVEVIESYFDRETGALMRVGDVVEYRDERVAELTHGGFVRAVSEPDAEPEEELATLEAEAPTASKPVRRTRTTRKRTNTKE